MYTVLVCFAGDGIVSDTCSALDFTQKEAEEASAYYVAAVVGVGIFLCAAGGRFFLGWVL